ncbi:MAG: ComEC/Rec2 family competence protein [Proteobacteria bacterium]|nr:ComEC/Rec2 family competence protein [Pseudomonadota bacterium]
MTGWAQIRDRLTETVAGERERWLLWAPVAFGVGVGVYFALPKEPPAMAGVFVLVAAGLISWRLRTNLLLALVLSGVAFGAAGFAAAQLRTNLVAVPVLEKSYGPSGVTGRVVRVELRPDGPRVTLEHVSLKGVDEAATPALVRIKLRRGDVVDIGDRIDVYAKLSPPSAPSAPGAYDFQRRSWFHGLGAVGFAMGRVRPAEQNGAEDGWSPALFMAALRLHMTERIRAALPGESGAIAAALMTGDRSAISQESLDAMRDSGLAHLLAISGLHLGLVAATLFFGLRALLALSERLTLRQPIKKWAAGAAMTGSFTYLLLAGATVPTQRAFVMTGLVLLAVLLDRQAISMRLVAWAAMIILVIAPEAMLGASFQMSFAAVVALVAFYEASRDRFRAVRTAAGHGIAARIGLYAGGVAATSIVAGFATGLIALHHFGRIAVFGLPANMLAVPLTALWIMPWAVMAAVLMPLGLEGVPLTLMGWGIEGLLWVAGGISAWPGAVRPVAALPIGGLVLVALGGLWLCLWRRRWRYAGLLGIAAGLASLWTLQGPDILVSDDGRLMAVRMADGELSVSERRREKRTAGDWREQEGQGASLYWPENGISRDGRLRCDGLGCIYRAGGWTVALLRDGMAHDEDCRIVDVLISQRPVRGNCPAPSLVIDRFDLWRHGAAAIWFDGDDIRVRTVADFQGARPWSSRRDRGRER